MIDIEGKHKKASKSMAYVPYKCDRTNEKKNQKYNRKNT